VDEDAAPDGELGADIAQRTLDRLAVGLPQHAAADVRFGGAAVLVVPVVVLDRFAVGSHHQGDGAPAELFGFGSQLGAELPRAGPLPADAGVVLGRVVELWLERVLLRIVDSGE